MVDVGKREYISFLVWLEKSFVINLILSKVRSDNIALAVASGISATLLKSETEVHSRFKIPIDID